MVLTPCAASTREGNWGFAWSTVLGRFGATHELPLYSWVSACGEFKSLYRRNSLTRKEANIDHQVSRDHIGGLED